MDRMKYRIVPVWLMQANDVSAWSKILWSEIRDRENGTWCWAGAARLARDCGMTSQRVYRCQAELVKAALLDIIPGGRGHPTRRRTRVRNDSPLFDTAPPAEYHRATGAVPTAPPAEDTAPPARTISATGAHQPYQGTIPLNQNGPLQQTNDIAEAFKSAGLADHNGEFVDPLNVPLPDSSATVSPAWSGMAVEMADPIRLTTAAYLEVLPGHVNPRLLADAKRVAAKWGVEAFQRTASECMKSVPRLSFGRMLNKVARDETEKEPALARKNTQQTSVTPAKEWAAKPYHPG